MTAHWKMQRWSMFQFQSSVLLKYPIVVLIILLISVSPQVFAEDIEDLGLLVEQQKIILEVGKHSNVNVKHVIETGKWNPDRPRIIEILPGVHSNLSVADEDGDLLSFSYDKETFAESKYIVLEQKAGCCDLIAEYDLQNFMELKNDLWSKELKYNFDVIVMIEEDVELIFANSRPVDVSDAKGINCIGCDMLLELFNNDSPISNEIVYDGKTFDLEILSNGKISEIEFVGGGAEILNFEVEDQNQLFTIKIPLELFLNPFDVYFTEKDDTSLDQLDKIRKTEYAQNDTHVNLSFRTNGEGVVSIVGANSEEHQKILDQIQKRNEAAVASSIVEKEKGVAIPLPGQTSQNEKEVNEGEEPKLSFEDELQRGQQQENSEDYAIILVIIGIIVAIIIGVIIKIKKN